MKRWPWITIAMVLLAAGIHTMRWDDALQWQRGSSLATQFITAFTSHVTHWSWNHWLWNSLAVLALGSVIEHRSRRGLVVCVITTALAVTFGVAWGMADITHYRGLSGIASGLFTFATVLLVRTHPSHVARTISCIALLAFAGKCAYESVTGNLLFVDADTTFIACPIAHLAGGSAGLVAAWLMMGKSRLTPFPQAAHPTCPSCCASLR